MSSSFRFVSFLALFVVLASICMFSVPTHGNQLMAEMDMDNEQIDAAFLEMDMEMEDEMDVDIDSESESESETESDEGADVDLDDELDLDSELDSEVEGEVEGDATTPCSKSVKISEKVYEAREKKREEKKKGLKSVDRALQTLDGYSSASTPKEMCSNLKTAGFEKLHGKNVTYIVGDVIVFKSSEPIMPDGHAVILATRKNGKEAWISSYTQHSKYPSSLKELPREKRHDLVECRVRKTCSN